MIYMGDGLLPLHQGKENCQLSMSSSQPSSKLFVLWIYHLILACRKGQLETNPSLCLCLQLISIYAKVF